MIGTTIANQYEILDVLGEGGFGVVYLARQVSVNREVAFKVLTADGATSPDISRRFEAEARITSSLRHPNTIRLIDFGHLSDGRPFLVTELLKGATLEECLRFGALPVQRVLAILREVCEALEEAHEAGIVHRDLKPGNIFLEQVGRREIAKVLDFGIAKVFSVSTTTTKGMLLGTLAYMSPEQVRGDDVDARTDLYSLGIVAFHALTGNPPFQSKSAWETMRMQEQDAPPPLQFEAPSAIRREVERLVLDLLAKAPGQRPSNAAEVIERIDRIRGLHADEPERTTESPIVLPPTRSMKFASEPAAAPTDDVDSAATTPPSAQGLPLLVRVVAGILVVSGIALAVAFARREAPRSSPVPAPKSAEHIAVGVPPGPPESVQVMVDPPKIIFDPTDRPKVIASILDAAGKPIWKPITWQVEPTTLAKVEGDKIVFLEGGRGTLKGCAQGVCGAVEVRATAATSVER